MAFNELDLKRIEKAASDFLALRRPPPNIRAQVDLEYTIHNQTIELLEVRPRWNKPVKLQGVLLQKQPLSVQPVSGASTGCAAT